jgi:hypothetical protein
MGRRRHIITMKKANKERLFEVMGRLDKTFKPINEELEPQGREEYSKDNASFDVWYNEFSKQAPTIFRKMKSKFVSLKPYYLKGLTVWDAIAEIRKENQALEEEQMQPEPQQQGNEFLPITTPVGSPDDKLFTDIVNQGIDSHLEGFTKSKFEIKNGSNGNRKIFNFSKSEIPILVRRLQEMGTEEADQWAEDIQNYDKNINEIAGSLSGNKNTAADLIFDFPGHARSTNPPDSPQYKWYQKVMQFVQGDNNVNEKAEIIQFFQNNFLGMDYDVLQTPAEMVSWWLSPEEQEFITGELNADGQIGS